jgi:two-component system NtrC family response regulator
LHELSGRPANFVDLNCAALPENLADGELFGWERGAFTGAHRQVPGLLELADGGTLFLDEACSLPVLAQAKLLRALERGEHRRVGGRVVVRANFRLVLAFSEEPEVLVPRGKLRLDFFCRVSDAPIRLPPLRARGSDIQLLAAAFLAEAVGDRRRFTTEALARLAGCRWPGNVRELRQLVARLAVFTGGAEITERDLLGWTNGQGLLATREDLERALALHGGDVSKAARALGMPRSTFRSRLGHARRQNGNVHQGGDRH